MKPERARAGYQQKLPSVTMAIKVLVTTLVTTGFVGNIMVIYFAYLEPTFFVDKCLVSTLPEWIQSVTKTRQL
jgi:hypothetical protein